MNWPFSDPSNVAVFTNKSIVEKTDWIQHVSHDEDDGAWQFHPLNGTAEEDVAVVSLRTIVETDPSVTTLFDLPLGWSASRKSKISQWERQKNV